MRENFFVVFSRVKFFFQIVLLHVLLNDVMKLLIGADFGAFEGDVLEDVADWLAIKMFVEVDIGSDSVGLLSAVSGDLMNNSCLFGISVHDTWVVRDIVIPL
jgi:hypothetical protein